jgi:hypothetical protein
VHQYVLKRGYSQEAFDAEDVKDCIKKLKYDAFMQLHSGMSVEDFYKIIDKLAGEKLI